MMETLGHLHPRLIHFPIGLLLVASMLIIYSHVAKKEFESFIHIALWVGFVFSILASISGWLLSNNSEQDHQALLWHQWTAICTCIITGFVLFLKEWRFYLSFILFGAICFTGHLGSVLTYGEGYFLFVQKKVSSIVAPVMEKSVTSNPLIGDDVVDLNEPLVTPTTSEELIDAFDAGLVQGFQARQISLVEQEENRLSANFLHVKNDFVGIFREFQKLAPWVLQLKLANHKSVDFSLLKNFSRLEDLDVSKTNLGDGDLVYLRELTQLKRLNLVGTQVSDGGLGNLMAIKNLKKVYVWQSSLSPQALEKWKQANPDLLIETGQISFVKPDSLKTLTQ